MKHAKIQKIRKRDGRVVPFDQEKITNAVWAAAQAVGGKDRKKAEFLSEEVMKVLERKYEPGSIPAVEHVQDIVEKVLIEKGHAKTAKAYILYREQHKNIRELTKLLRDITIVDDYLEEVDWRVRENSNMTYSLQGLNVHITHKVISNYWLNSIYPKEIRDAHINGEYHIHDLGTLGAYCVGWDLEDLLMVGFRGVRGKIESNPAKHFDVALMQIVNFMYTLQGEAAGAQALSSFDTLLAPFIYYDKLDYKHVKQSMQKFLFNMNVPTRVGFQTPFTNCTLDLTVPKFMRNQPVIFGGKLMDKTYSDFQKEMDMLNKAFAETMLAGDATSRPFTFPIPTYNITKDFEWENPRLEPLWEMTAKYGIPYFANFINSDMRPDDVRSMCCRLRLDKRQLNRRGGGLFGSNPLTGSVGVVTINLPRIAYEAENELDFFDILEKRMELAKESLIIKRDVLERFTDKGLYPYSMFYLRSIKKAFGQYWKNHFSTIGIIGMNDALLNFSGHDITHPAGRAFAIKVMDFMRKKLADFQEETGNIFNLEATPAEGASYRLAKIDNKLFPKMKVYNQLHYGGKKSEPYYTNSTQLPVGFTNDIFVALKLQDPLQTKYTGGCIEKGNKVLTDKGLLNIEYIVKNFEKLIPIKALSYNSEKGISEWDEIVDAIDIDVEKRNKIRMKGERNLDITTSDWHPFFILEKINVNPACPVCGKKVKNVKAFAAHLRYNKKCRKKYSEMNKYRVVEKRGDELKRSDYILQNSDNLYPARKTELNDDLMWLIGFFSGDGSISEFIDKRGGNNLRRYKVRFYSEQKKSLEKAGRILARYFHVKAKVIQNDRRSKKLKEVTTSKKSVWHFFFKYGFRPGKKVYNVCIPQKIKENINKNNVFSLLSGLAGSDGHISKRDGDFEYSTVSPRLANDILEICSRAGIMVSKKEKPSRRKNEVNIYRLRIPQYQMTRIRDKMNITVNHARIKNTLSNRKKRQLPVIRVKEVSKVDVNDNKFYDLMTNKNHNYLAGKNSLVFVHNTVLHGFIGEKMPSTTVTKALVKTIAENFHLPYFTVTPSFSICERHGYISGEHDKCPKCGAKCEVWSRSVGYLRPVEQWNAGKQAEFKDRKTYDKQLHVQTMPKKG